MTKQTFIQKNNGDTLSASEWNELTSYVNTAVDAINEAGSSSSSEGSSIDSSFLYLNDKGNLCLETTAENTPAGKKGKLNIESKDDLQLKPGDDFNLCAHHRGAGSTDQVLIKVLTETNDETEIPANIKINSGGNISLTNKDNIDAIMVEINPNYTKTKQDYDMVSDFVEGTFINGGIYTSAQITSAFSGQTFTSANSNDVLADILGAGVGKNRKIRVSNGDSTYSCYTFTKVTNANSVTNINVEGPDGHGYLKVRAQAIDLRCETHGGIALQPKGEDSDHHMNKIKFEHGGGDGLEFGTFNTEHTSLFTGDYRFNKNGTIKLATRTTVASDKADPSDSTTAYKYVKAADDFYDNISAGDPTCTWEDVVNTANHITTYKLDDQNNTIDGGVLKVKGINNSTTNTLTITTANPSNGTVQDYVIPAAEQVISANTYTPQTIASCSINDIIMFVNWAKGTGYGPWSSQAIADKEELRWSDNGFAAVTPATPGENPVGE